MNKRTKILAISAVVILSSAVGYRVYDSNAKKTVVANTPVVKNGNSQNTPIKNKKNIIKKPERGYISQSVESLARQIVENAPNQDEAFSFLVEAKSYRIQELRKRRAKERAEEEKARYDAELWNRKRGQIDLELAKELEVESIDTQAGQRRGSFNNQPTHFQTNTQDAVKAKKLSLNDFVLRAIIKENGNYIARLAYNNKYMPAKTGYKLFGEVNVDSVSSNQVVLTKGDKKVTLYAY